MVVMILERVSPGLRGELTRWFLEPKAGVFVGRVSAMVRDRLWEKVCGQVREGANKHDGEPEGGCLMIHTSDNEQGFKIQSWGQTTRSIEDFGGLFLVRIP
ncbi:MAG: type I-E CRISPR-associated endoribonuclease Cas2 [Nitrospirae bacterium]|nr:type I-E CRISPR-associated endoribonuclease Cas2 [Nitrospirota bacterium]